MKNRAADRIRAEASLRCFQSWGSVVWWSSFWNKEDFINIFHLLGGLVLRKNSKILLRMFLEEGPEPCPKAAPRYLFFFFFKPQKKFPGSVKLQLQLLAYATAIAMPDPSQVCHLHHSSRQCRVLNPLSEARD